MDVTTLEKLKKEAAEALSAALGNSTQWCNAEALGRTLATLDGMELDDDDYVPQLSREEAVKAMADLSGLNSVVRGTTPAPRCTLCDLGAPPHAEHGLKAKFVSRIVANSSSCLWCKTRPKAATFTHEGCDKPVCAECVMRASRGAPPLGNQPAWLMDEQANVPSGKAMLLDSPAPTPKQEAHIRRETLEVAAQYLENLKLVGAHECAEAVRGLKSKAEM